MPRTNVESDHHDCLECRMIGTGAMLTISGYMLYISRTTPLAEVGNKRFAAAMSVVFAAAGATRWFL